MESKTQTWTPSYIFLVMLLFAGLARSDVDQDKTECANQLVGLAPCLPYVGGTAKAPTIDCCSGLKTVLDKSRKCLCVLIKDKDDPSLGLKINTTLAALLPNTCHAPVNMTDCVALLHLTPNSKDAKMFEDYQKLTEGGHASTPAASGNSKSSGASTAAEKSDGGKGKKTWVGVEIAFGISLLIFTLHQNFGM